MTKNIISPQPPSRLPRIFLYLSAAAAVIFPFLCFIATEYPHFADKEKFFLFLSERRQVVVFDLLLIIFFYLFIALLTKRVWPAALVVGFFTVGFGVAEYYKIRVTGDNVYPWDVAQQGTHLSGLLSFVNFPFPALYIMIDAAVVICFVLFAVTRLSLPPRWFVRLPLAALMAVYALVMTRSPDSRAEMLNRHGLYFEDMALQSSNYAQNGFLGAFTINVLSGGIAKPDGYYPGEGAEILSRYGAAGEDSFDQAPDIIFILSESFWDCRQLPGTEYTSDPMANFDRLAAKDGVISGKFYTTGFGGGTDRPEFESLTGLSTDYLPDGSVPFQYIQKYFPCYPSMLKEKGYRTIGLHPYLPTFYQRQKVWPLLGIDEQYFTADLEKLGAVDIEYRGRQVSDMTFVRYIEHMLGSGRDSAPVFIFGISMENHQPYDRKFADEEFTLDVSSDRLDGDTLMLLRNFAQGMADADEALAELCRFIDGAVRPTMLVYYGDHAPTLGPNLAAYAQSGLIADASAVTAEERQLTQSTPFMVYANFRLSDNPVLHAGRDNKVTSYNLMNGALQSAGFAPNSLMMWLTDYAVCRPDYNIRMAITPDDELWTFIREHSVLTYEMMTEY